MDLRRPPAWRSPRGVAVHLLHDRQIDPVPLVAVSAAATWTRSLAAWVAASTGWPERRTASPATGTGWPSTRPSGRQALGRPYVWDGNLDGRPDSDDTSQGQIAAAERRASAGWQESSGGAAATDPLTCAAPGAERAVIGDDLRQLAVWCQMGACIARHTDAAALGEADIRSKAVASGWCLDAFGRLVCPSCQQLYPVWSARPPALRARDGGRGPRGTRVVVGQHRRTYSRARITT